MIRIRLEPEMSIEPGHQWLVVSDSPEGWALVTLLMGHSKVVVKRGKDLLIPHDARTDENIIKMINTLAHVRYQSPELVQLTMIADPLTQFVTRESEELE
jgi:hypothetical protein